MAENKGKPSARVVASKGDPWSRNSSRSKATPGIHKKAEEKIHPGGDGGPEQNAGGPKHHGAGAREDRNP